MALVDINLTDKDQAELKAKLDAWRVSEKKKIEEELTEKYEQMEAELKEQYERLVEEIKDNMKKVYTKRFTKALKEMYEEIKAEVIVENMNSPEQKAFENVKTAVYPFMNESASRRHKEQFQKLAQMYESALEELELLKGANKKAQLLKSLSPEVSKVVDKLLGEGTEEDIVTRFAAIKEALKNQAAEQKRTPASETTSLEDEGKDTETEPTAEETSREFFAASAVEEGAVEEPVAEAKNKEFMDQLNEQLILAGVQKRKRIGS
jgi:hypothetical protein